MLRRIHKFAHSFLCDKVSIYALNSSLAIILLKWQHNPKSVSILLDNNCISEPFPAQYEIHIFHTGVQTAFLWNKIPHQSFCIIQYYIEVNK